MGINCNIWKRLFVIRENYTDRILDLLNLEIIVLDHTGDA